MDEVTRLAQAALAGGGARELRVLLDLLYAAQLARGYVCQFAREGRVGGGDFEDAPSHYPARYVFG